MDYIHFGVKNELYTEKRKEMIYGTLENILAQLGHILKHDSGRKD